MHADKYPYPCTVDGCIYRTVNSWSLRDHIASVHSDEKQLKCHLCDFAAKTKTVLLKHKRTIHEGRLRYCDMCDFTCPWDARTKLLSHKRDVHMQSLAYKCNLCTFSSGARPALQAHMENAHRTGWKSKSHKSREYKRRNKANGEPVVKPDPVWRYWCSECGALFQREYGVNEHIRKLHDPSMAACGVPTNATKPGSLLFKCSVCNISSSSKAELDDHLRNNHDSQAVLVAEYTEDENFKPTYFACDQCNFKSENWCGLKSHVRARHERKLHRCHLCTYVSFSQGAIGNHLVRDHGLPRQHPKRVHKKKSTLSVQLDQNQDVPPPITAQLPTLDLSKPFTVINSGGTIYIDSSMPATSSA